MDICVWHRHLCVCHLFPQPIKAPESVATIITSESVFYRVGNWFQSSSSSITFPFLMGFCYFILLNWVFFVVVFKYCTITGFDRCVFSLFVPAGCLLPDRRRHQGNGWGRWEAVLRSDSGLHARPVLWKKRCPHLADPHPVQSKRPVWSWDIHCW